MSRRIFCIGGAAIDRKLKAYSPIVHGTSNPVTSSIHFGGVARNVAENLIHWTNNVYLHTAVGDDEDGVKLLSTMKDKGVDITHSVILKNMHSASYFAVLDQHGDLDIAMADMAIYDHVPVPRFVQGFNAWDQNSIVFLDTNLPVDIIQNALNLAREKNIKLCIDPVSVAKSKKLPGDLHGIHLIKPNPMESSALTGMTVETIGDALNAGQRLHELGAENVIITLGKAGYIIVNDDEQEFIEIEAIHDIVNVNGAGDAFMAGVIYGLQQSFPLRHACQWGAAAAAFTVSSPDTVAQKLTAQQLESFIHNQKIISGQTDAAII